VNEPGLHLDSDLVFRLRPDCRYRKVVDEGVILRQTEGEVLVSNRVGATVMDRLDGATPVAAILDGLVSQFEVDRPTAERDLSVFLHDLLQSGVIEPRPAADI